MRAAAVIVTGLALGALTGCTSAVDVTPAAQAQSAVCRSLASAWPATVSGHERREVSDNAAGVAYGDPAIIARCGVGALAPTTNDCIDVDGIGWVATSLTDGTKFVTFGRDPAIEVLVPKDYAPEPLLLPAFSAAAKRLPTNGLTCR